MNNVKIARCKYCNQVYLMNEQTLYVHTVKHKIEYEAKIKDKDHYRI